MCVRTFNVGLFLVSQKRAGAAAAAAAPVAENNDVDESKYTISLELAQALKAYVDAECTARATVGHVIVLESARNPCR